MHKHSSTITIDIRPPVYIDDQGHSLTPKNQNNLRQPRRSQRFHKITQDLDKSFTSHHQDIVNKSQVLSKVERKDTRQSDPEPFDYILKIQQQLTAQKNNPVQKIILKSQADPFLRRKLKAVVDDELKCLKKLNDQKNKVSTYLSKTISSTQSLKILPKFETNSIDEQISRLPKDISKILNSSVSQFTSPSIKRIQSQENILAVINHDKQFQKKKQHQNRQVQNPNENFTTLRRELYKKKINCLEVLRVVVQKSLQKGKNQ